MTKENPHPKTIIDEVSGVEVSNPEFIAWEKGFHQGYEARSKEIAAQDKGVTIAYATTTPFRPIPKEKGR